MAIKHVGHTSNNKKVVVAYRTLPGDPHSALVIPTASLSQTYHDELFQVVDSQQGQDSYELATILSIRSFSDGSGMLSSLHRTGKLKKVATNEITMTPSTNKETFIRLDELNKIIAEQRGVGIDELAITETGEPGKTSPITENISVKDAEGVLTDEDLAAQYRSQADQLYKEVQELRKKADELSPKKSTAKKTAKIDA